MFSFLLNVEYGLRLVDLWHAICFLICVMHLLVLNITSVDTVLPLVLLLWSFSGYDLELSSFWSIMVHVCLIIVSDGVLLCLCLHSFSHLYLVLTPCWAFSVGITIDNSHFLDGIFIFDNSIWSISFINLRICTYVLLIYLLVCSDGDFHRNLESVYNSKALFTAFLLYWLYIICRHHTATIFKKLVEVGCTKLEMNLCGCL